MVLHAKLRAAEALCSCALHTRAPTHAMLPQSSFAGLLQACCYNYRAVNRVSVSGCPAPRWTLTLSTPCRLMLHAWWGHRHWRLWTRICPATSGSAFSVVLENWRSRPGATPEAPVEGRSCPCSWQRSRLVPALRPVFPAAAAVMCDLHLLGRGAGLGAPQRRWPGRRHRPFGRRRCRRVLIKKVMRQGARSWLRRMILRTACTVYTARTRCRSLIWQEMGWAGDCSGS